MVSSLCCEGKKLGIIYLPSNGVGILQERIMLTRLDEEHEYTAELSQFCGNYAAGGTTAVTKNY